MSFSHTPRRRSALPLSAVTSFALVSTLGCSATDAEQAHTYVHSVPTAMLGEWDPAQMYTREPIALRNVYETLTYYNADTEEVEPLLATDWQATDDGQEWTFELREDVTFHSGEPLTAQAVTEAIERTIDVDGGPAYLWDPVEDIDPVDEHTVAFDLAYPAPLDLVTSAAYGAFIYDVPDNAEAAVLDEEDEDEDDGEAEEDSEDEEAENTDSPFHAEGWGTGPYTVAEFTPGEETELILDQFDDYWQGWQNNQFERVEFRVIAEQATAAQLLQHGTLDSVQSLPAQLLEATATHDDVQIHDTASHQNLFAMFNTDTAFSDATLRQAVVQAINYAEIAEATEGDLAVSEGIVPSGPFGADTDVEVPAYDPDEAEELMDAAGHDLTSDILQVDLTYNEGEPAAETAAEILQSQLADLNIEIHLEALPQQAGQLPRARETEPEDRQDIYLGNWWPDNPEANAWYSAVFESEPDDEPYFNLSYYDNPEVDEAITEVGELTATDPEAAHELYTDLEQTILDDAPVALLGDYVYRRAIRADIDGFRDNPLHPHTVWPYAMHRT